ncbi:NusA-like transcription termination signal-binding factor [Methanomicrobium antiquum]|uniref:Probable transcription termination protein NusA n=1 Tax=Methanomicrobium antiquum TaxID=487686 RepID=A0AAF0JN84_9EURY|nr:NusA-like transcription termination signal-binding factor [Methanomicrobium antiquum]MDD3977769.1 NusA-like transcription termination signal-binding factor [Methanomicrobium sp.]WFN37166.1 NusA-like transcription termination signal-binding factor [Methanomicrobium antiquum]
MLSTMGFKERRYIEELRIVTKSTALDCIIDDSFDRIIYVIKKGDMGFAIGKEGVNIKKMQKVLGRRVEMVEENGELFAFIENIFKPAHIVDVAEDEESKKLNIFVKSRSDLGIAIGKSGCNIEKARILVQKHFGREIGEIIYSEGSVN